MRRQRHPYVGRMHSLRAVYWRLAFLVTAALLASACGGTEETASPLYVDLPEASQSQSGLTTTTATGVDARQAAPQLASLDQERFDEVEAFYDQYLQLRANSIDRTDEIEVIDAVVTVNGRAEVVEALAYNDGLHADGRFSAVDALYLYSNVDSISQVDDGTIVLVDCTEQHEINALDQHLVFFPTAEVRIVVSEGEMRVESYTLTHNGYLELAEPIGCAPTSFRERAEATAAQVWTDLAAWGQDPAGRSDDTLSALIGGAFRERVLEAGAEGFVVDEHVETSEFSAIGLDSHGRLGADGPEGLVVQVESCHRFPEGRSGFDPGTQTEVQDLRAGAEQALRFHVLLDPDFGDERVDQVVAIDYLADRCVS